MFATANKTFDKTLNIHSADEMFAEIEKFLSRANQKEAFKFLSRVDSHMKEIRKNSNKKILQN
ncbi:hypothetical protein WA1_23990 [Scytonema hofmannii PCC 7110]|uniref:Uncharacterized protein n=1 Tax=Scytonema hofmannii PCC 7110 TaxID=128403 RepID=A0A139X7R8_9CYAN|nr:hypothetical protein [Scytonema hofmannii]KYC40705.1 hypothetical protein WA1_23990 [Scytonema hofmannii PCC 7110]